MMALSSRSLLYVIHALVGIQVLVLPACCLPSTRVVYYLHTRSATWNEASSMCSSYGAVLLTMSEFSATHRRLLYVDRYAWDQSLDGLNEGFWSGLYRNSTDHLRWQKCTEYDSTAAFPVVTTTAAAGSTSPPSCYRSTPTLELSALGCDVKLPYVCERDDGQCWFQPYVNNVIEDGDSDSHTLVNGTASDEAECAKLCRSSVDQGRECWAFSFGDSPAACRLHFSAENHKYALSIGPAYFKAREGVTAYVKICTGGWKTTLQPASTDGSTTAKDENCTIIADEEWDSAVCYCECDQPPIILEAETLVMTIEEKVDQIVKELHVDPENTSSTRRKKISVEDSRPSAQGIGYVGVAFLVLVFGGIFLMDVNVLYVHAAKLWKGVKGGADTTAKTTGAASTSATAAAAGAASTTSTRVQTDA